MAQVEKGGQETRTRNEPLCSKKPKLKKAKDRLTKVNIMRIDECLRDHPCNLVCMRNGSHEFIKCSRCLVVDSWSRDAPHHLE